MKGLGVCNDWDLELLDLLNGLALGCYQPSTEISNVSNQLFKKARNQRWTILSFNSDYGVTSLSNRQLTDKRIIQYIGKFKMNRTIITCLN